MPFITQTMQNHSTRIRGISGKDYSFDLFFSALSDASPFPDQWNFDENPGIFLYARQDDPTEKILGYALSTKIHTKEEFHRILYLHPGKQADSVYFLPSTSSNEAAERAEDLDIMNLLRLYTCL